MKWQQGDVILRQINEVPTDANKKSNNHVAEGETTGHFHAVHGKDAVVFEKGDVVFINAPNGCDLTHQEHSTISLPSGSYEIGIVREYDPFEETINRIRD